MKERPIICTDEEVRAILAGRKTQIRRPVKPQPPHLCRYVINGAHSHALCFGPNGECVPPTGRSIDHRLPSSYGSPGDRLWVREAWQHVGDADYYRATDAKEFASVLGRWQSPIHMPRRASRITLEIVSVRVERVQETSYDDCIDEGWNAACGTGADHWFREAWDRLNAKRGHGWDANPWVWVVEFRRVNP
jgi:hypothetical protein